MKTLKFNKSAGSLDRKLITRIGEIIYHKDEIKSVKISVNFKDGSTISFNRSEEKDLKDRLIEEYDEEDED